MDTVEYFLGLDVGGTNFKFGLVDSHGNLLEKEKFRTASLREQPDFGKAVVDLVGRKLAEYGQVHKVGIGVPGMISKDRTSAIRMANLPEMNGLNLVGMLKEAYPDHEFHLENDANAAALGEYHFGEKKGWENFIFVTMGTGVGSAAIINGELFVGVDGNGMEMGHMVCSAGTVLEAQIGKQGLVSLANDLLDGGEYLESILYEKRPLNSKKIVKACLKGDEVGMEVFKRAGGFLGEGLVSAIRLLDIKTIYLGGGVSQTFEYFIGPTRDTLEQYLPNYYLKDLEIKMASLGNEAGIIGAASLCFLK